MSIAGGGSKQGGGDVPALPVLGVKCSHLFLQSRFISMLNKYMSCLNPLFKGPGFFSALEEDDSLLAN